MIAKTLSESFKIRMHYRGTSFSTQMIHIMLRLIARQGLNGWSKFSEKTFG